MALRPPARTLLMELISIENGQNNGLLFLSEADAADRMGVSTRKSARHAFEELVASGLIACTSNAYFNIKTGEGRARSWALTWLFDYGNSRPATHIWKNYKPTSKTVKRVAKGMSALKRFFRQPRNSHDDSVCAGQFDPFDGQ